MRTLDPIQETDLKVEGGRSLEGGYSFVRPKYAITYLEHGEPAGIVMVFPLVLLQGEKGHQPVYKRGRCEGIVYHLLRLNE